MKRIDRNHYQLDSGRTLYANIGILGIAPPWPDDVVDGVDRSDEVSYGYDGQAHAAPLTDDPEEDTAFTASERREIALFMMAQWKRWAGVPPSLSQPDVETAVDEAMRLLPVDLANRLGESYALLRSLVFSAQVRGLA